MVEALSQWAGLERDLRRIKKEDQKICINNRDLIHLILSNSAKGCASGKGLIKPDKLLWKTQWTWADKVLLSGSILAGIDGELRR